MYRALAILALCITTQVAKCALWYVDGDVTGTSANSGVSWANAWTNFSSINWSSVSAGDTVYLSGGTWATNQTLDISKSGTYANRVTVKMSQEAGHNDMLYSGAVSLGGNYITVDGSSRDDASNYFTTTWNVTNLSTYIRWQNGGVNVNSGNGLGEIIRWITITNQNADLYHAIKFNPDPNYLSNCLVEYVYVNRCGEDGIQVGSNGNDNYDALVVKYCWLDKVGDDGIECGPGTTVHHCVISSGQFLRGHPDAIQSSGNHQRFYNNVFYDFGSSLILFQGQAAEGGHYGFNQMYGNELYYVDYPYGGALTNVQTTEIEAKWYPADTTYNRTNIYYTNWINFNNTYAYLSAGGMAFEARGGFPGGAATGWISNIFARNIQFKNNFFWKNTNNWFGIPYHGNIQDNGSPDGNVSNYWDYVSTDVQVDYNFFTTNGSGGGVGWFGTNYATGELLSQHLYKSNWSVGFPILKDAINYDFRPYTNDVAITQRGTNLTAYNLPGYNFDLYGQPRRLSIGASEPAVDASLRIWLSFDNDFTNNGIILDSSGYNNHAYHFGRTNATTNYATNWPIAYVITNTPGRSNIISTDLAGNFKWFTNTDYGLYNRDGAYAGITNVNTSDFTNRLSMTICIWARYFSSTNVWTNADYSVDGNATLVSWASTAGGNKGAWNLGRYNQVSSHLNETRFYVNTNNSSTQWIINYPDAWAPINDGNSTNWHHYAFTWTNGVFTGYYDGAQFTNVDMSATVTTLTLGSSGSRPYDWIGIGTDTHLGTPLLENEAGEDYPNNGWFNGVMDDFRYYTRALSSTEISNVVAGVAVSGGSGGGGGGGGGGSSTITKFTSSGKLTTSGKIIFQ